MSAEVRACVCDSYGPCVGGACMCVQCMRGWGACVCNMVWRVCWGVDGEVECVFVGGWGGKDVLVPCKWGGCVYCDVVCMKVSVGPEGIQVGGVHLAGVSFSTCVESLYGGVCGVCGRNVCMLCVSGGGGGGDV